MLTHENRYGGLPARLYRYPSQIQADISTVKMRLCEIENMLSVREMLLGLVSEGEPPDVWIPKLEQAIDDASEALCTMRFLNDRLGELSEELGEVKCLLER